jgi:hypothetical protein
MKKMNCVHTRRAYNLMKNFLNDACDLHYTCVFQYVLNMEDDMTEWKFSDPVETPEPITIQLHKGDRFCADGIESVEDAEDGILNIYYNFKELSSTGCKVFRSYWTKKSAMLKGFSNITLSLLHELGHFETADEIRKTFTHEDRFLAMIEIHHNYKDCASVNNAYFQMPDETAATEWAIEWLSNPENRKKAKAFEKKFFACFE